MVVAAVHRGQRARTHSGELAEGRGERFWRGLVVCRVPDAEATSGDITPTPKAVVCPWHG